MKDALFLVVVVLLGVEALAIPYLLRRWTRSVPREPKRYRFKVELQRIDSGDVVLYFHEPISPAERGLVEEALARGLRLAQGVDE